MTTNPIKQGVLTTNATSIGIVSRKMVRERAVALAAFDGRPAQDVSKSDWDQAKRQMTGESGVDRKDQLLESAPESGPWDQVHGSTAPKIPAAPSDDERLIARWEGEGGAMVDRRQSRNWGGVWQKSCLPRIRTIPVRGGNTQLGFAVQLTASITAPKRKLKTGQHGTTFQ